MSFLLPMFALLTLVGSWAAWRKSPLYSLKTTLKLVGAFVGIVACVVGTVLAIFYGPARDSQVAQGVLIGIAVMVFGIGASLLIVKITDGHVAQLPPSVKLVTLHRHRMYKWVWRLAIYLLICAGAALAVPASWFWLPTFLGGFVLLVCGPMMAILLMMARRNDRAMTVVMAAPWVHWVYSPERWAAWASEQREWEEGRATPFRLKKMVLFVGFCGLLFGVGAVFAGGGWRENVTLVLGLTAFVAVMLTVLSWVGQTAFGRHYRRMLTAQPESYFGDEGVFCNGVFSPWVLSGKYLIEAGVERDAAGERLLLVFESFNGSSSAKVVMRVLVPEEHLGDLAVLQARLRTTCRTATVRLAA